MFVDKKNKYSLFFFKTSVTKNKIQKLIIVTKNSYKKIGVDKNDKLRKRGKRYNI